MESVKMQDFRSKSTYYQFSVCKIKTVLLKLALDNTYSSYQNKVGEQVEEEAVDGPAGGWGGAVLLLGGVGRGANGLLARSKRYE